MFQYLIQLHRTDLLRDLWWRKCHVKNSCSFITEDTDVALLTAERYSLTVGCALGSAYPGHGRNEAHGGLLALVSAVVPGTQVRSLTAPPAS